MAKPASTSRPKPSRGVSGRSCGGSLTRATNPSSSQSRRGSARAFCHPRRGWSSSKGISQRRCPTNARSKRRGREGSGRRRRRSSPSRRSRAARRRTRRRVPLTRLLPAHRLARVTRRRLGRACLLPARGPGAGPAPGPAPRTTPTGTAGDRRAGRSGSAAGSRPPLPLPPPRTTVAVAAAAAAPPPRPRPPRARAPPPAPRAGRGAAPAVGAAASATTSTQSPPQACTCEPFLLDDGRGRGQDQIAGKAFCTGDDANPPWPGLISLLPPPSPPEWAVGRSPAS